MTWFVLLLASLLEVVWALALKRSDGFTQPLASAVMLAAMIASTVLLAVAMRSLPLGTAYAVWTGLGAIGTFAVGGLFLGEALSAPRLLAAALIAAGVVLMKAASPA